MLRLFCGSAFISTVSNKAGEQKTKQNRTSDKMNKLNIKIIKGLNRDHSANYSFSFDLPTGMGTVIRSNFISEIEAEKYARHAVRSLECTRDLVLSFDFINAALAIR